MKDIFGVFKSTLLVWLAFSFINWRWPGQDGYAVWNFFTIDKELYFRIFTFVGIMFISCMYGYSKGKDETSKRKEKDMKEYKKLLDETAFLLDKLDEINEGEETNE